FPAQESAGTTRGGRENGHSRRPPARARTPVDPPKRRPNDPGNRRRLPFRPAGRGRGLLKVKRKQAPGIQPLVASPNLQWCKGKAGARMKSSLWIATAVLFSVSVWAQNSSVGTGRYDQQIQQEVTKVLQSKDKWRGVTSSTDDGIATLQGSVKLLVDKLDVGKKVDKL